MLTPNPRVVSRELLTRDTFQAGDDAQSPRGRLAAVHGPRLVQPRHEPQGRTPGSCRSRPTTTGRSDPMRILRTRADPTRPPGDRRPADLPQHRDRTGGTPRRSTAAAPTVQDAVRAGQDGKLRLEPDGSLPRAQLDRPAASGPAGGSAWRCMHTLFTREHNAICDAPARQPIPSWSDDELFDRARLVNAALMAKIHTVEWTPAIIGHPTLAVRACAQLVGPRGRAASPALRPPERQRGAQRHPRLADRPPRRARTRSPRSSWPSTACTR